MKKIFQNILWIILFILFFFSVSLSSPAQKVLAGPWLVRPGATDMIIRWEFDHKQPEGVVEYGRDTLGGEKTKLIFRESRKGSFLYDAKLTGLKPEKKYFYRLSKPWERRWYSFRTCKDHEDHFSFVAMGDSRSNPRIFSKIIKETEDVHPDLIISMGDLVIKGSNYDEWHRYFFDVAGEELATVPFVSTLGDHETEGDNGELFRYFLCQQEPTEKLWFSFDYGNAHFISLDYRHPEDTAMIRWFKKDIREAGKKWNFVFMHRPSYNLGGHRSRWGRDIWPDLFQKYKVDIVFAGHSHIYERFYPVSKAGENDGTAVTYITTGGAGAELYESVNAGSILAFSRSVNHFIDVKIDGDILEMRAIDMDGYLLDSCRIIKKNGEKKFSDRIISREMLNTITELHAAISGSLSAIPLASYPARYELDMKSYSRDDIPFTLFISKGSEPYYKMMPCHDTLMKGTYKKVVLDLFRKKDITITPWGEMTPELRFMMIYDYRGRQDTITGGAIHYWPPQQ